MLVFNDEESFRHVYDFLSYAIDVVSQYNLDLDYLDEYDYVLEQFESMLGHYSLRRYVAQQVKKLVLVDSLTFDNDPDDYVFPDKILRSIVNTKFELMIGSKLISLRGVQNDHLRTIRSEFKKQNNNSRASSVIEITDISNYALADNPLTWSFTAKLKLEGDCLPYTGNIVFYWAIYNASGSPVDSFTTTTTYIYVPPPPNPPTDTITSAVPPYTFPSPGKYTVCVRAERVGTSCSAGEQCIHINVTEQTAPTCCKAYTHNTGDLISSPNPNVRLKFRFELVNLTFLGLGFAGFYAKSKSYRKIGSSWNWRKVEMLKIVFAGEYHQFHCNGTIKSAIGGNTKYNKRVVTAKHNTWLPTFVKADKVTSTHSLKQGQIGLSGDLSLAKC